MTILGFQVVLLDEQGVELQRIPDVYYDDPWIFVNDQAYGLQRTAMEGEQRVRYFMRDPDSYGAFHNSHLQRGSTSRDIIP